MNKVILVKFQFQNGTIRRRKSTERRNLRKRFQFQNGTIRRGNVYQVDREELHFNSKMVRLEVLLLRNICSKLRDFNSKMVRLEGVVRERSIGIKSDFNSKMVRLEVINPTIQAHQITKFQFQNGTIRS